MNAKRSHVESLHNLTHFLTVTHYESILVNTMTPGVGTCSARLQVVCSLPGTQGAAECKGVLLKVHDDLKSREGFEETAEL